MDLQNIEKERTGLVQFLIVLITLTLGFILYISWQQEQGILTQTLTIFGLLACLYAIAKERSLRQQHDLLVETVDQQQQQVHRLGAELEAEKVEIMQLEDRLRELTALNRAISIVNAVPNHRETFDAVLRAALDLVEGNRGSLMLVDAQRDTLYFASAVGIPDDVLSAPGPMVGDGVAGWVAKNAEPVLLTGKVNGGSPFHNLVAIDQDMSIAMSVPLRVGEKVIGVLNLGSTAEAAKQSFSDDEVRFAYLFAQHAAIAVDRANTLDGWERDSAKFGEILGSDWSHELRGMPAAPPPPKAED